MVTCTTIGTCHHEANVARVNSINNTFFNIKTISPLAHNSLMVESWNTSTLCFCSLPILSFNFLQIYQMVICPVRRTYNQVQIFFCFRMKKTALKLASLAIFCNFYLPILVQNFSILSDTWILVQNCQMVTFTIIGTCHHEVNLVRVNSFNNTFSNIK